MRKLEQSTEGVSVNPRCSAAIEPFDREVTGISLGLADQLCLRDVEHGRPQQSFLIA